jgi:hypothetical protein
LERRGVWGLSFNRKARLCRLYNSSIAVPVFHLKLILPYKDFSINFFYVVWIQVMDDMKRMKTSHVKVVDQIQDQYRLIEDEIQVLNVQLTHACRPRPRIFGCMLTGLK